MRLLLTPAPLRIALAAVALTVSSCVAVPATTSADEAAIRASVVAMTQAFNARDDAALVALSTPDADFVTVVGRWSRGPAAYAESRRSRFTGALKNASIRPLETHIRFIRPDVAVVHVTHEMSGMLDEAGKPLPPHPELSTRLYVKQNGRWLLSAFHNTGRPPPRR